MVNMLGNEAPKCFVQNSSHTNIFRDRLLIVFHFFVLFPATLSVNISKAHDVCNKCSSKNHFFTAINSSAGIGCV